MRIRNRQAFTLFVLLVVLALFFLLLAMLFPLTHKLRLRAQRIESRNNLHQLALACHNFCSTNSVFPSGNDSKNFSAVPYLLPYLEQDNVFGKIDYTEDMDDKTNAEARKLALKFLLSPQDPVLRVKDEWGATNYLFSAGTKPSLKDNDGVCYQDSKVTFGDIEDGTSNTLLVCETLKGDGGTKAVDVKRQHVVLKAGDLEDIDDETGIKDFKDNKNIVGDRCASWMDGRFLQGTFTATRLPNDDRPDVSCGGVGGLSALRSLDNVINVGLCDGSVHSFRAQKVDKVIWKALATRAGGEVTAFPDN